METGRQVSDIAKAKTIPVGFKLGGTDQGLRTSMPTQDSRPAGQGTNSPDCPLSSPSGTTCLSATRDPHSPRSPHGVTNTSILGHEVQKHQIIIKTHDISYTHFALCLSLYVFKFTPIRR